MLARGTLALSCHVHANAMHTGQHLRGEPLWFGESTSVRHKAVSAHHLLAIANPFGGEGGGTDAEEGGGDVAGNGAPDHRLASAWRPEQEQALCRCPGALQHSSGLKDVMKGLLRERQISGANTFKKDSFRA